MKNWAPLLAALSLTGCSAIAGAQGLTHRSISGALEVPASCEHPATVMKGDEKTWKPGSNDSPPGNTRLERDRAAFGDITGDGSSEAIATQEGWPGPIGSSFMDTTANSSVPLTQPRLRTRRSTR